MPRKAKNMDSKQCSSKVLKQSKEQSSSNAQQILPSENKSRKIKKEQPEVKQNKFNRDRRQTKKIVNQLEELIRALKRIPAEEQQATKAYYQLKKIMSSSQPQYNKVVRSKRSKKNCYEKYCEKVMRAKILKKYILFVKKQMSNETTEILDKQFWGKYQKILHSKQETLSAYPRDTILQQIQSVNYLKDINISQDLIRILGHQVPDRQDSQPKVNKRSKKAFLDSIDKAQFYCLSQISAPLSAPQIQKDLLCGNIDNSYNKHLAELRQIINQDDKRRVKCPSLIASQISRFSNIIDPKYSNVGDYGDEKRQKQGQFYFQIELQNKSAGVKQQVNAPNKGLSLMEENWGKFVSFVTPKLRRSNSNRSI